MTAWPSKQLCAATQWIGQGLGVVEEPSVDPQHLGQGLLMTELGRPLCTTLNQFVGERRVLKNIRQRLG